MLLAALTILVLTISAFALLVLVLKFGPGRGTWNQPAAAFRAPGRAVSGLVAGCGVLMAAACIVLASLPAGDGFELSLVVLGLAMAAMMGLLAACGALAPHIAGSRAVASDVAVDDSGE